MINKKHIKVIIILIGIIFLLGIISFAFYTNFCKKLAGDEIIKGLYERRIN